MDNILLIYATTDGQTHKISSQIKKEISSHNQCVKQVSLDNVNTVALEHFDKIIIGASIRYGKHHKDVYQFVSQYSSLLASKKSAFYTVNAVARKTNKNNSLTNPYLIKFIKNITWKPKLTEVFAGKVEYSKYKFFDKHMIRFIMWLTNGPTQLNSCTEYTDWNNVKLFAAKICKM